jgi:ribosomal-protein-alanine N-acetyltransferase
MMGLVNLFWRREPLLSEAGPRDAAALASLHAASFQRGWSEDEMERLLLDRAVVAHRATVGRSVVGFILSRIASDEAEILSVGISTRRRGRGLARSLLALHMRSLAGRGVRSVFLEVGDDNVAAKRLYDRAGFREVGRRQGYYRDGPSENSTALVLRRDLA